VKFALLAVLIAAGGTGGLYFSGGWPADSEICDSSPPVQPQPSPQRFLLSTFDAKDTVEAPTITSDPLGRVFVAWASKTGAAERTVFLTRSSDGGQSFDAPRSISKGGIYKTPTKGKFGGHERRGTPHILAVADKLYLARSEAMPDGTGQRMVLAGSTDAGLTFSKPMPVHREEKIKAAFTSFRSGSDGSLACTWLDDRSGAQQPFASIRPGGASAFEPERLVHTGQEGNGVCPCCPTACCFAPDGTLYVAFRNIQDGYRDIALGRLRRGQSNFEGPIAVIPNTWKFDGCPHDGPSLIVLGDTLHIAWMDARTGVPLCYYGRAKLNDMVFEVRELHAGASGTQGNPKLMADASGGLYALWEESTGMEPPAGPSSGHNHGAPKPSPGSGRGILHAYMPAGQLLFGPALPVALKPGAFQTRPSMTVTPAGHVFAAWMELDESGKSVVVTRLPRSSP
jgi:hypothetical protein